MALKYSQLGRAWLETIAQPAPVGYEDVTWMDRKDPVLFATPEDMAAYGNAADVYDLYMKPSNFPWRESPPAFNTKKQYISSKNTLPHASLISSRRPVSQFGMPYFADFLQIDERLSMLPESLKRFVAQGVASHELGHAENFRLNPAAGNKGFLRKNGIPQTTKVQLREDPAWRKESDFWWNNFGIPW